MASAPKTSLGWSCIKAKDTDLDTMTREIFFLLAKISQCNFVTFLDYAYLEVVARVLLLVEVWLLEGGEAFFLTPSWCGCALLGVHTGLYSGISPYSYFLKSLNKPHCISFGFISVDKMFQKKSTLFYFCRKMFIFYITLNAFPLNSSKS